MATLLGPWSVQYPTNFVANGDTVHQGFYKHIQEISRIYGLLNALDSGKVTTSDLTAALGNYVTTTTFNSHVNSASPHPNLTLGVDKITGNWPLSRVSGSLAAGNMDIAGLKNNLLSWVQNNSGGITDTRLNENGYVKFGNGLIIQWGTWGYKETDSREKLVSFNFNIPFPNNCFCVQLTENFRLQDESIGVEHDFVDATVYLVTYTKSTCNVGFQTYMDKDSDIKTMYARYLAIGY